MSRELVERVLAELGPRSDLLAIEAYDGENAWVLHADEDTPLVLELDVAAQALVLSAIVGTPADRVGIHELLLEYNGQWRESGGLVMSLDAPDGAVIQHRRLSIADCTPERLRDIASGFVAALQTWRAMLARTGRSADEVPFDALSMQASGFIRG